MSDDLKPCPFCGGPAVASPTRTSYIVECNNAGCRVNPDALATFKHDAIAAWNRRSDLARTTTTDAAREVDVEAERPRFETWAASRQFDLRRPHNSYINTATDYAWMGYCAKVGTRPGESNLATVLRQVRIDAEAEGVLMEHWGQMDEVLAELERGK